MASTHTRLKGEKIAGRKDALSGFGDYTRSDRVERIGAAGGGYGEVHSPSLEFKQCSCRFATPAKRRK
jgi:hypothetical protein